MSGTVGTEPVPTVLSSLTVTDSFLVEGSSTLGPINPKALDGMLFVDQYASIQAAHDALPATGGTLILPSNTTYTQDTITIISKPNVVLMGQGWSSVVKRGTTLPSDLIRITGTGCLAYNFTVDGNGAVNATGTADLALSGARSQAFFMNCINSGGANGSVAMTADDTRLSHSRILGLGTSVNTYGVWAISNKRIKVDHCTISLTGIDGVGFDGTGSEVSDNNFSLCHCYTPVGGGAIVCYPTSQNVLIANNAIEIGTGSASGGIELNGNNITVVGNIINAQKFFGMAINSGAYAGYLITGNTVRNSGLSAALLVNANISKLTVVGNRFIDDQGSPTQTYGVQILAGTSDNIVISGNDLTGNLNGPAIDGGTGLNKTYGDNLGIDNVLGTIASAATITMPLNPVISLTGSVGVGAINGALWTGREGMFIPTGAVVFTAGATIGNTVTTVANVPMGFTCTGAKIYLG